MNKVILTLLILTSLSFAQLTILPSYQDNNGNWQSKLDANYKSVDAKEEDTLTYKRYVASNSNIQQVRAGIDLVSEPFPFIFISKLDDYIHNINSISVGAGIYLVRNKPIYESIPLLTHSFSLAILCDNFYSDSLLGLKYKVKYEDKQINTYADVFVYADSYVFDASMEYILYQNIYYGAKVNISRKMGKEVYFINTGMEIVL
jgi:hypothetical protein